MTHILLSPLTGAFHRPPAKQLLSLLPAGTFLHLEAEPDNPYDEFAIQVWLDPSAIPPIQLPNLDTSLEGTGYTASLILREPRIQLGYIAASAGKPLAKAQEISPSLVGNREFFNSPGPEHGLSPLATGHFTLQFAPNGFPLVRGVWQESAEEPTP